MKNPFVIMAAMAAAALAATREAALRDFKIQKFGDDGFGNYVSAGGSASRGSPGPRNPAGAKLIRKFYRNKFGVRGTWKEAAAWHQEARP